MLRIWESHHAKLILPDLFIFHLIFKALLYEFIIYILYIPVTTQGGCQDMPINSSDLPVAV